MYDVWPFQKLSTSFLSFAIVFGCFGASCTDGKMFRTTSKNNLSAVQFSYSQHVFIGKNRFVAESKELYLEGQTELRLRNRDLEEANDAEIHRRNATGRSFPLKENQTLFGLRTSFLKPKTWSILGLKAPLVPEAFVEQSCADSEAEWFHHQRGRPRSYFGCHPPLLLKQKDREKKRIMHWIWRASERERLFRSCFRDFLHFSTLKS